MKRKLGDLSSDTPQTAVEESSAKKLNRLILRRLQRRFESDPEADLLSLFPTEYVSRLSAGQSKNGQARTPKHDTGGDSTTFDAKLPLTPDSQDQHSKEKTGSGTNQSEDAKIVFPLASSVDVLLKSQNPMYSDSEKRDIVGELQALIAQSPDIWRSAGSFNQAVLKCSEDVVVKIVPRIQDHTEYTALQYLERQAEGIPAPKALGLIMRGTTAYIFMSFVKGQTLRQIWSQLNTQQKTSISHQLEKILVPLRLMTLPTGMRLGGVGGEPCKDTRRRTRTTPQSISTCAEFEDFVFADPVYGAPKYIKLLRSLKSKNHKIVFTHGDLRDENILVDKDSEDHYVVTAIIDWEMSGFYPEYFESVKATNCMSANDYNDWHHFPPESASPKSYAAEWLVDWVWDKHVA